MCIISTNSRTIALMEAKSVTSVELIKSPHRLPASWQRSEPSTRYRRALQWLTENLSALDLSDAVAEAFEPLQDAASYLMDHPDKFAEKGRGPSRKAVGFGPQADRLMAAGLPQELAERIAWACALLRCTGFETAGLRRSGPGSPTVIERECALASAAAVLMRSKATWLFAIAAQADPMGWGCVRGFLHRTKAVRMEETDRSIAFGIMGLVERLQGGLPPLPGDSEPRMQLEHFCPSYQTAGIPDIELNGLEFDVSRF
jgi:hypothetical protein